MRLDPKRLRSIEDLEREKKLLLRQSRKLEEEDFLSIEGLLGKKKSDGEDKEEGSLLDFLPISNPLVDIIVKMIKSRLSKKSSDTKQEDTNNHNTKKKGSSPLRALAFEFIGGYLKWKAIELSFRGIRHMLKTRKEKRNNSQC